MDRNIGATAAAAPPPGANGPQEYLDRLYKIIPAEVTAAYLAVSTLLADPLNPWILAGVRNGMQIVVSTISFPIWAISISAAMVTLAFPFVTPETITVVRVAWVLVTPLLVRP